MKKENIQNTIFVFSVITLMILSISAVSAASQLLCLSKGQTIKFSQCNSAIKDKKCLTSSCQICANQVRDGVYCPLNINECDDACVKFEEPISTTDVDLPKVTLLSPLDNEKIVQPGKVEFTFSATDSSKLKACSLTIDEQIAESTTSRIQTRKNTINSNLAEGIHVWSVECKTKDGKNTVKSKQRTLLVGANAELPSENIELINPQDNLSIEGSQNVNFQYNLSDSSLYDQCNLAINDEVVSASNDFEASSFSQMLEVGAYNWKITCMKKDNSTEFSQSRTLTITPVVQQNQENSGSSGGGSSGGSGGGLTRNSIVDNKKSEQKPAEVNNSPAIEEISQPVEEKEEEMPEEEMEEKSSETTKSGSTITGAVTGVTQSIRNNKTIALVFILVIVGFVIMVNAMRSKQEDKQINKMIKSL